MISSSSVAFVSDSRKCAAAVNGHGQALLDAGRIPTDSASSRLAVAIEAPRFEWISPTQMLLGTRRGDGLLVRLDTDGPARVNGISVRRAGIIASAPSCLCSLWDEGVAFYGSAVGDSYLLRLEGKKEDGAADSGAAAPVQGEALQEASSGVGGVPGLGGPASGAGASAGDEDEDAFLFAKSGSAGRDAGASQKQGAEGGSADAAAADALSVSVLSTLPGVGPITSAGLSLV